MIPSFEKVSKATKLFIENFPEQVVSLEIDQILPRVKFVLEGNIILYIRYNDYGEYSYQIIFSNRINDWIRYDNYDSYWDVKTMPNHKHIRNEEKVMNSLMTGDPVSDIPRLIEEILRNLL